MNYRNHSLSLLNGQNDLFGDNETEFTIDRSFHTAKRVELDEYSWVEIVPGWASGASVLFEQMLASVPWAEHQRRMFNKVFLEPRMTAAYPDIRQISQEGLLKAMAALSDHYGVPYDGLWMNLYRSGRDGTGWHRDYPSCRKLECIVPVLTLGASRKFLIKPIKGGSSLTFIPSSGDLVVMGGRAQQDWVHCVPKEPGIPDARISVNFMSQSQAVRDS
ncbi:alpha-ketoglutarate-dependent dioxygenase AlkB [Pseudomonas sp. URIL14HWK12:I6]|uniref:alpha-ketoglutarate-dependent dioxygenase AlkB n=1 Tax=Pseudomonas sp. URIL14HWK12:I6 TaxID=1283293 RepID=UPI0004B0F9A4|nr:alpha-ketoglutarate-dependent dioxygenase AlkB [Pseudomonas sp. URIL14HWK12:I6]